MSTSGLHRRARQRGFTLIEIMVVVIIIGILISLVGANIFPALEEAETTATQADMRAVETALSLYRMKNARFPSTEEGLEVLVSPPGGESKYMDRIPQDSWGNEFQYRSPGQHGDYDLWSLGCDNQDGGEGPDSDITSWDQG